MSFQFVNKSQHVRLQNESGQYVDLLTPLSDLSGCVASNEVAVSNAGLTELAGAINASNQMDVNIAASGANVPVSASSLPLPTGAATSAKQPALGIAGSASSDVITVQGISGGVPLQVSSSTPVNSNDNAWANATNGASVSTNDTSNSIDLQYASHCVAMINTSGTSTFKLQFSADSTNWYDSGDSLVMSGSGTGCIKFDHGARYARLFCVSGSTVSVDAGICGK